MYQVWLEAVLHPKETFAKEKGNADLVKGMINFFIAGILSAIFTFFMFGFMDVILESVGIPVINFDLLLLATAPIFTVINSLIIAGIIFIVARFLGGEVNYVSVFYLISLYAVPIALVSWIPFLGIIAALYSLYLLYLAVMEATGLPSGKTIFTIILMIVAMILFSILGASFMMNQTMPI